jgi:hypothetical protein
MQALDGNAIAGSLAEVFGADMTMAVGRCVHCATRSMIAELAVYPRVPGPVARCRTCGNVVMVVIEFHGGVEVRMDGFELERPPATV